MAFKGRAELAEQHNIIKRKISGAAECDVERGSFVSGGPEHAIAGGPRGIRRIVIQHVEVESGGDIHDGEGPPGVARTGRIDRGDVDSAHFGCRGFELVERKPWAAKFNLGIHRVRSLGLWLGEMTHRIGGFARAGAGTRGKETATQSPAYGTCHVRPINSISYA